MMCYNMKYLSVCKIIHNVVFNFLIKILSFILVMPGRQLYINMAIAQSVSGIFNFNISDKL